jgi:hypothetical protein
MKAVELAGNPATRTNALKIRPKVARKAICLFHTICIGNYVVEQLLSIVNIINKIGFIKNSGMDEMRNALRGVLQFDQTQGKQNES